MGMIRPSANNNRRPEKRSRQAAAPLDGPPVYVPQRRRPVRFLAWLFAFAAVAAAGGLLALALVLGWQYRAEGRILPGISVAGQPLEGLTAGEAAAALENRWGARRVVLAGDNHSFEVEPAALGILFDAAATAEQAAGWTRSGDLRRTLEFIWAGGEVAPVWTFERSRAEAYLAGLAGQVAVPPVNAGVRFEPAAGRLVETPPLNGRALDVGATLDRLNGDAGRLLAGGRLELTLVDVAPEVTSTAGLIERYNERLSADLSLSLFDPISGEHAVANLPAAVWTGWLAVTPAGAEEPAFAVNTAAVPAYVQELDGALGEGRSVDQTAAVPYLGDLVAAHLAGQPAAARPSLRVYHGQGSHVVQSGETLAAIARAYGFPYPWLQQANPGLETLYPGQEIVIPSPDVLLPLPVVENKRIVVSIGRQKLWAYEHGELKWEWTISTGIDESPTSPGIFQVQSHEEEAYAGNWDLWMPKFVGIYRPVPSSDFMNGFHGFPTRDGYQLLWTSSLGRQVTYGCILVGDGQIDQLYDWAEAGTVVEVIGD